LLAYGLLHFPLRQWSSREGGRIRRAAWLAPLLVGAAAGCGPALLGALTRPRAESRSDLVLISVDTLRRDAVRAYGGGEGATPSLDRLAGEGTRLLGMRAPSSWTLPSHAAMLTGRWPWSLGVFRVADALSGAAATLAERLAAQGYDTHAVVTHLFVDAPYGFGQGFDRIEHPPSELARDAVKAAGGWLARRSRAPAFLFLHLYDPHWPYQPPDDAPEALLAGTSAADRREAQRYTDAFEFALALQNGPPSLIAAARALYHAEVWSADRELGKLFAQVRQSGRPTVIAVVSDHGEMFGEHGMIGHGITLFEDEVRVPCLIAGAGVPGGVTLDGPASLVDLAPTLLELTGVKAAAAEFDGRSLAAALRAGAPLEARWVAGENRSLSPTPTRYLSDGNWKWFSGIDQPVRTARVVYPAAVHHVDRDPAEATDLTGAPDLPAFAELAATLFAEEGRAAREVSLDPAERARLRSLGYLP
jgi:arylsulfatase A-like enzyme